jgi:hypothetical protein
VESDQIQAVWFGANKKEGQCFIALKDGHKKVRVTEAAQEVVAKAKAAGVKMVYLHNLWVNPEQIKMVTSYRGHLDEQSGYGGRVFAENGSKITMDGGAVIRAYDSKDRILEETGIRPGDVFARARMGRPPAYEVA